VKKGRKKFLRLGRFLRVLRLVRVENFQPLQKVGNFRLPMLVFSPTIKGLRGLKRLVFGVERMSQSLAALFKNKLRGLGSSC